MEAMVLTKEQLASASKRLSENESCNKKRHVDAMSPHFSNLRQQIRQRIGSCTTQVHIYSHTNVHIDGASTTRTTSTLVHDDQLLCNKTAANVSARIRSTEVLNMGAPSEVCSHCGAIVWNAERTKNKKHHVILNYQFVVNLESKVDRKINDSGGPYAFRIKIQNYHRIGTLLPSEGHKPKFAQLYIYDTENEVQHRMNVVNREDTDGNLDHVVVEGLIKMFDDNNWLTKAFQMARDRFRDDELLNVRLRIIGSHENQDRQYDLPTNSEVAAIMVRDGSESSEGRDIIVQRKDWISKNKSSV